jgi:hypothetical protein
MHQPPKILLDPIAEAELGAACTDTRHEFWTRIQSLRPDDFSNGTEQLKRTNHGFWVLQGHTFRAALVVRTDNVFLLGFAPIPTIQEPHRLIEVDRAAA